MVSARPSLADDYANADSGPFCGPELVFGVILTAGNLASPLSPALASFAFAMPAHCITEVTRRHLSDTYLDRPACDIPMSHISPSRRLAEGGLVSEAMTAIRYTRLPGAKEQTGKDVTYACFGIHALPSHRHHCPAPILGFILTARRLQRSVCGLPGRVWKQDQRWGYGRLCRRSCETGM